MIPLDLAEHIVATAMQSASLREALAQVYGPTSVFARLELVEPANKASAEAGMLMALLDARMEAGVLAAVERWEASTGSSVRDPGLSAEAVTLLDQRRYTRTIANVLRHTKHTAELLAGVFKLQRGLFDLVATKPTPATLEKLRELIFVGVGQDRFEQAFFEAAGYDLMRDFNQYAPYCAVGEVLDIPANSAAYKQAMAERPHWEFSKFTVTPVETEKGSRWLIFFA